MSIDVNSVLVLLVLLPLKMCAAPSSAAADVVLGSGATVFLENCSCGDECQLPQHDGFTVNCSTIRSGLTLADCVGNAGGFPDKCLAVTGDSKGRTLVGCSFPTNQLSRGQGQCGSLPRSLTINDNKGINNGGRKIKLNPSNSGGVGSGALCCGFISGENRTNEQQQQFGQHGNSSNLSPSPREVESVLKASPGSGPAASKTNGNSSHSALRGPESSEHDGTSEKLSASNSTTTPTKNDMQNEGTELGAMKVVVKCAAVSLFISSAFF
ncbi:hypothetical protein TRVL_09793 [Trypanosoma vivax]|nr:hypothetical protein TRVL_09793 [Trypanosoma vivax]